MPVDTFDKFVKQRTEQARQFAEALNPKERLASWQHELDSLYQKMEGYLKDYVNSGLRTERRRVQLTEDDLGSYEAEALAILIGRDEVIAEPVGTMLIGSMGRVDLSGPRRVLRIVLLEKSGPVEKVTISGTGSHKETVARSPLRGEIDHRGWYLVTPPPAATATPLNEDSFRDAIMDVSGG
ncbi:MAG: hypothetical protein OXF25_03300 [Cyanobacteria bacterium MAG CAR3_bin_5]|nr:hypothetical protein [Cyanobacteria bacterium MAG CAR3_bin_5]